MKDYTLTLIRYRKVKPALLGIKAHMLLLPKATMMALKNRTVANKKIKYARCAGWDANTQAGFAIMPCVPVPLI
tara:strand:- start:148 stop:369 length:222 start_codon:yes stop_codon:yes gene_type:complete